MQVKYYEVIFDADGTSICIKGKKPPTTEEAAAFLAKDMKELGFNKVEQVREISVEEAESSFDMENEARWPVFG